MAAARKEIRQWVPQAPTSNPKEAHLHVPFQQVFLDPYYTPDLDTARFQIEKNESKPLTTEPNVTSEMRVVKKVKDFHLNSLFIKANDQIINLKLDDVLWVEAYGDYINFVTEKTKYLVHSTMKSIEGRLPEEQFARVHRSFIIRPDKIDLIEESLIQIGKKLIPIGESYRQNLLSRLNIL